MRYPNVPALLQRRPGRETCSLVSPGRRCRREQNGLERTESKMNLLTTVTDRLLLDRMRESKMGKAIAQELEDKRLAERAALVASIAEARSDLDAKLPALEAARAQARSALEKQREALKIAEGAYNVAAQAERNARSSADMAVGHRESQLIEGSSPAIGEFLRWLQDTFDAFRYRGAPAYAMPASPSRPLTKEQQAANTATREHHDRAFVIFREVREQAEALRLEAISETDLAGRLQGLLAQTNAATR